jgi:hypothetical protein
MSDQRLESHDDGDPCLPSELAAAIERARLRTASPAMVEKLQSRVLEITAETVPDVNQKDRLASGNAHIYWLCTIAASIGLILSLRPWMTVPVESTHFPTVDLITSPVYSPITTVSLTQVGFRRIEEDMDRVDAQVEEASEGLALASVRHEIQETLEEFYDWSR